MAMIAGAAIEVRPTNGSDLNGGGFTPGVGTKTVSAGADLTIDASVNTKVTAGHSFVSGDVNKFMNVTAGTGWVTGYYQIVSVSSGAATLDRSPVTSISAATGHSGTYDLYDGIDYSQQNSAQVVIDNSAITTSITTNVVTFTGSTHATTANEVGNYVHFNSGTNITAGWWRITAVSVAANNGTWTLDSNVPSSGTTTNAVGKMGGALQGMPAALGIMVRSNKVFVKAESTITRTATMAITTGGGTPDNADPLTRIIGYTSSRTDGGRVSITLSTNSSLVALYAQVDGISIENFNINCASLASSIGIENDNNSGRILNCKVTAFKNYGIFLAGADVTVAGCEVASGGSGATQGLHVGGSNCTIFNNFIHDNPCPGLVLTASQNTVVNNLITNNTGASSDGISSASIGFDTIVGNTIYGSGRDGIRLTGADIPARAGLIKNNILVTNSGWGMNQTNAAFCADIMWDGNAYYNNTSGTRNNLDDGGSTNVVNGVSPYLNTLDVILTADPFNNSAGGDFTLNNNAGGGNAVRSHGVPATYPGGTGTSYPDMGAFQAQAAGGGGAVILF